MAGPGFRIELADLAAHRYRVTLTLAEPSPEQVFSLPVWIPGSYLVREFAKHLSGLSARQGARELAIEQLDKASWRVRCSGQAALVLSYDVYGFDASVRTAWLDGRRAFFNASSLCLRAHGREAEAHRVELSGVPEGWQVATGMRAVDRGFEAADYDELVDHPFEIGPHWQGEFTAAGVPHRIVVAGAWPSFDGERLLADVQRICEAQIAFWGGAPFERYSFLLWAVDDGHGGLEHRASTALICARRELPTATEGVVPGDNYARLLGLFSHEYFHAWNVKRLMPRNFERYDYAHENYTDLLWFFEGFTSYYDDLFLLRSGLIDDSRYLKLLARTISNVAATPGRRVQSVADASFDAWVKYYRNDENTPNATISYYTKGSLVALAFDLSLRSEGKGTLDDVMRLLWARSGGGPISEADIAAALQQVGGRSFAKELVAWVHGTDDLPLQPLLERAGVEWSVDAATLAQRLGVRVGESALTGIKVSHVLRGGAAERAGLAAGDELLAVAGWRVRRLDDALRLLQPGMPAPLLVNRDQRVLTLNIVLPPAAHGADGAVTLRAAATPAKPALALRKAWLGG